MTTNLVFKFGGQFSFHISPAMTAQYFGINQFALPACIYLFGMMRVKARQ